MRDKERPFVVYRRGPGSFTIVPRGVKGWIQFSVWIALLALHVMWFTSHAEQHRGGAAFVEGLALFCIGALAWIIAGVWWMLAHGEVVEVAELLRDKQRERRRRQRGE